MTSIEVIKESPVRSWYKKYHHSLIGCGWEMVIPWRKASYNAVADTVGAGTGRCGDVAGGCLWYPFRIGDIVGGNKTCLMLGVCKMGDQSQWHNIYGKS